METATYAITGIPLVPGSKDLPVRREIGAWTNDRNNQKQIDLFLLALKQMQETPPEQLLSYYRIAGIHSYPLTEWDGVKYERRPPPASKPGFCAHNLSIFPTWHRPYMALYEQHLHTLMLEIIGKWKLSTAEAQPWLNAANTFRLPYWDWAQKQSYINDYGIPEICTRANVTVQLPGGQTQMFKNPLAGFSNPTGVAFGDKSMGKYAIKDNLDKDPGKGGLPWSKCIGTSRYGIFKDRDVATWDKGVNDWQRANRAIKQPESWYGGQAEKIGYKGKFSDAVERMLSPGYHNSFETFGNTSFNDPSKNTNFLSLEYIHNVAHVSAGGFFAYTKDDNPKEPIQMKGLGHMSDVPVSAFDPIFFFHHCNIDRLTAFWQTFNPDKWFQPKTTPDEDEKLEPFHTNTSGAFWTSKLCRDWTKLNFQYDDLAPLPQDKNADGTINQQAYIQRLRTYVNVLYKGTSNAVNDAPSFLSSETQFPDYIVNLVYDRYALNGRSYAIMLFLGDPPSDDELYLHDDHPNYLGQVYTFSSPIELDGEVACENCDNQRRAAVLSTAQIPVTLPLMQKVSIQQQWHAAGQPDITPPPLGVPDIVQGPIEPELVRQLFAQDLHLKYVALGGDVLDPSLFPRTEIALLHAPATFTVRSLEGIEGFGGDDVSSIVPRYDGQYQVLYKPTRNEEGNIRPLFGAEASSHGLIRDDPVAA